MNAVEASALASSSACTIVVWPRIAAPIRAVRPRELPELCRLTLAPRCSSIRTSASCPPSVAAISNVLLSHSAQPASRPPPSFNHATTACASPAPAAINTATACASPSAAAHITPDNFSLAATFPPATCRTPAGSPTPTAAGLGVACASPLSAARNMAEGNSAVGIAVFASIVPKPATSLEGA
eukprot:scaffold13926_cov58-Phaeocystis_antarctica.AAC.4